MTGQEEERPEGLLYVPDFLTAAEEAQLLAHLRGVSFSEIRMRGQVARRRSAHFGWLYGYESWQVEPGPALPDFLLPLRSRCAVLMGEPPEQLVEALLNEYPPGAAIGWHRDAPMFGQQVVGVSLGGACRMRFQRDQGEARRTYALELAPRSAYVLGGESRSTWQHSIPAVKQERYSITFRTLKAP
ncbi:alpha-ketoglutarate-dependent dioxygenase AlkB [Stigmatella sp. ncwal1]|uniref:Alpha-ketoglutarate-dependent dioxygenase AlkB n=1 Tax=Stigmatella ashevillensis TaxID=2995309 RepID=A0ABT5D927_9BACT|nr:alpha-ketoglutarate-dependent dioxygenase AlkB [Stigmatella ashevillena]MDC0709565.1 alpha-ketoglutarate-dependent dioxygenase AlkB [Stigmatella ashevillena]